MKRTIRQLVRATRAFAAALRSGDKPRQWAKRTLVVGPVQPVDGDSVACTAALIDHLRKRGLEAFTLPTLSMYRQIDWILTKAEDYHPACHAMMSENNTVSDLQAAYDTLIATWRPDEIVLVDGHILGFDPRGVKVFTIDHHIRAGVGEVDNEQAYIKSASACGCLLIDRYGIVEPILAVAILTDTFWFRQNCPAEAIEHMAVLAKNGLTNDLLNQYQKRLMVRKNVRILNAMKNADARFSEDGDTAFVVLKDADPETHRGVMAELGYFCRHMCAVRADGYVSFRTVDDRIDLRPLATKYGYGGHPQQAAGHVNVEDAGELEQLYQDFIANVQKFGTPPVVRR